MRDSPRNVLISSCYLADCYRRTVPDSATDFLESAPALVDPDAVVVVA